MSLRSFLASLTVSASVLVAEAVLFILRRAESLRCSKCHFSKNQSGGWPIWVSLEPILYPKDSGLPYTLLTCFSEPLATPYFNMAWLIRVLAVFAGRIIRCFGGRNVIMFVAFFYLFKFLNNPCESKGIVSIRFLTTKYVKVQNVSVTRDIRIKAR